MLEDNSPLFKPGNYNVLKQKTVVGSARSLMEADLLFHFPQFKFLMRLSNYIAITMATESCEGENTDSHIMTKYCKV